MKPKVLILFPYSNHNDMVKAMVESLRSENIEVDAYNTTQLKFIESPVVTPNFILRCIIPFFSFFPTRIKISILRIIFPVLIKNYNIIDFHVFNSLVGKLFPKVPLNKKTKITIWGSDFYRASDNRKERQRSIYKKVDSIQISTPAMKNDFLSYFREFDDKINIANFGIFQFDILDALISKENFISEKVELLVHKDRLIIVCGYNGSKGQQHKLLIERINNLPETLKNKIHLIFPMTYGAADLYINDINDELKQSGIPYTILRDHMSHEEIASLRLITDIALNIQISDAFSGSLQEHLYAGSILLVGEWLPYSILDDNHVFYLKASLEDFTIKLSDIIENHHFYKNKTVGNKAKMEKISSWRYAAGRISTIYKSLIG